MMDEKLFHNENYWVSPYNYFDEVRAQFDLPEKVLFHDVTLRDGEQSPGVAFRADEKVRIAKLLDELGVDRIEVALPAVSEEDAKATKGVVALRPNAKVFVLCRGIASDVELALECGVDGIILELPVGIPRLKYQFSHWSEDDVVQKAAHWAKYAKSKGLEVVLFPMDCTRSRPEFFTRVLQEVGALPEVDGVSLVDTSGSLTPQAATYLIKQMKEITHKRIEVHTHTDFGMGVATSLAALTAGAEVIHASIGGLGERTGNTPLDEAAVSAKTLYGVESNIKFEKLYDISHEILEISRFQIAPSKPVIGERAFTRESGMGVDLVKTQPLALFGVTPSWVGQEPKYVLGKKSGVASVEMKLDDLGLPALDDDKKNQVLLRVKNLGLEKKGLVEDDEFAAIVKEVTGS
jgi:isopropylmalate/homocitrate/citramalate synthase